MIKGLVLVKLEAGKEKKAAEAIKKVPGVHQVTAVFGAWDLVLEVRAGDLPTLTSTVVRKIRAVRGIATTETLIATAI